VSEYAYEDYRCCQIYACAQLDAVAGEGLTFGALYQPVAVIEWQDAAGAHRKLICDPKQRVLASAHVALKIAVAMAKRYVDRLLMPRERADTQQI
jgi:hypothetical protein